MPDKRKAEFINYHKHGDGDCNGQTLKMSAYILCMNKQQMFDLAYFYSITYCCASAIWMYLNKAAIAANPESQAKKCKRLLVFESDRRWVAQENRLETMLKEWANGKIAEAFERATITKQGEIDIVKALELVQGWYYFSRYSAYLFIETYCDIAGLTITQPNGLEYGGDRMTFAGGLFRYFGLDAMTANLRKKRKLPIDNRLFELMVKELQADVKNANGDDSWVKLETSLCAYDKMFKGKRYNGYYADRMLQEVRQMQKEPELAEACDIVMTARKLAIPIAYRGEDNGWNGIRKELKKYYTEYGEINWDQPNVR